MYPAKSTILICKNFVWLNFFVCISWNKVCLQTHPHTWGGFFFSQEAVKKEPTRTPDDKNRRGLPPNGASKKRRDSAEFDLDFVPGITLRPRPPARSFAHSQFSSHFLKMDRREWANYLRAFARDGRGRLLFAFFRERERERLSFLMAGGRMLKKWALLELTQPRREIARKRGCERSRGGGGGLHTGEIVIFTPSHFCSSGRRRRFPLFAPKRQLRIPNAFPFSQTAAAFAALRPRFRYYRIRALQESRTGIPKAEGQRWE